MQNARIVLFLLMTVALGASCASPDRAHSYAPVLATPSAAEEPAGSLRADFDHAARSASLEEAASRWREFLRAHEPRDGDYEDEFQKNLIDTAKLELMRADYMLGRTEQADSVLRAMNPLGM